jgi:hypothetical protein
LRPCKAGKASIPRRLTKSTICDGLRGLAGYGDLKKVNVYIFRTPYIWLTAAWLSAGLLSVFDPGGLLPPPPLILAVIIFLFTCIAWLVLMIRAVILRRLRYFVLLAATGVLGLSITYSCLQFSDEIHFQIMRPIYLRQISSASKEINEQWWDWGGGGGYDTSLYYLRKVTPSSLPSADDDPRCYTSIEKMSAHFFLSYISCD